VSEIFVLKIIKNVIIGFQLTFKNIGNAFLRHSVHVR